LKIPEWDYLNILLNLHSRKHSEGADWEEFENGE